MGSSLANEFYTNIQPDLHLHQTSQNAWSTHTVKHGITRDVVSFTDHIMSLEQVKQRLKVAVTDKSADEGLLPLASGSPITDVPVVHCIRRC